MRRNAATLVAALVATLVPGAELLAAPHDGSMSEPAIERCLGRNPAFKFARDAAPSLVEPHGSLRPDERIIGHDPMWVFDATVRLGAGYDVFAEEWTAKFPWLRTKAGRLRVKGHRVDGPGTFAVEMQQSAYPRTGFLPSGFRFSNGGCWKVTAKLRRTTIRFYMAFSSGPEDLCDELRSQVDNVKNAQDLPENAEYVARLNEVLDARNC